MSLPPSAPLTPLDWMGSALCAQVDADLWYPDKGESPREALRICRQCPVRQECYDYAVANGERFGVWGAATERTRRQDPNRGRRKPAKQSCGTPAAYTRHYRNGEKPCEACREAYSAYKRGREVAA